MEKQYIIVNYHYIEDPRDDRKGIWPCSVAEFERQIKFLSKNFKIVSAKEVFEGSQGGSKEKLCAITFDDGLKDQYINALPVLKKYGATATFFIITSVFDGNIPGTHKLHALLSRYSADDLIDIFNTDAELISKFSAIPKNIRINNERRLFEDVLIANIKEKLLGQVPADEKDRFLNKIFLQTLKLNEKELAEELFMSKTDVKKLSEEGFKVGSHGHGHYALNNLDVQTAVDDIRKSVNILSGLLRSHPADFSYPNGRYNEALPGVLKGEGFERAFSIEAREISGDDNPYLIPRFDTNNIKKLIK